MKKIATVLVGLVSLVVAVMVPTAHAASISISDPFRFCHLEADGTYTETVWPVGNWFMGHSMHAGDIWAEAVVVYEDKGEEIHAQGDQTILANGCKPSTSPPAFVDGDCGDFDSQAQAQAFFIDAGGPESDPHQLDSEGAGIACETLPCPCSTSTGGGGGDQTTIVRQKAKIVRVVDGDTVDVKLIPGGPKRRVRLVGIASPEVGDCGATRATRKLTKILPKGTRVRLVSDRRQPLKDRYGRLLRYVSKATKDVGKKQIRKGNARVLIVGDGFTREAAYRKAQRNARAADRGIWGIC
jgi:endonuclease YncB( thermonuclease family)